MTPARVNGERDEVAPLEEIGAAIAEVETRRYRPDFGTARPLSRRAVRLIEARALGKPREALIARGLTAELVQPMPGHYKRPGR